MSRCLKRSSYWYRTALYCAATLGHIEIARILIEHGANLHQGFVQYGYFLVEFLVEECGSPLGAAIAYRHQEIAEMIVDSVRFNPNEQKGSFCKKNFSYLMQAIDARNGGMIRRLLDKYAQVNVLRDDYRIRMLNVLRSYETSFFPELR